MARRTSALASAAKAALAALTAPVTRPSRRTPVSTHGQEDPATAGPPDADTRHYPGDFEGRVTPEYAAQLDGEADPGEIVWTWVPYEEDFTQGKDRPVLVLGRDGDWLLALMLTSKDHDRDAADEARWGRRWMDIGAGAWDSQGRPSEVRLDRVIRVHPAEVRREGAVVPRPLFDAVVDSL